MRPAGRYGFSRREGKKEASVKTLLKANHILGKVENFILAAAILCITALMICNTIGRTMLHSSIHATEELCAILILVVTFVGLSNAARNGRHIIMTAIYDKLPHRAKRISNILTNFLLCVLLLWITCLSFQYTVNVYTYKRITTVLAIPVYLSAGIIPAGCALGVMQYFITMLLSITDRETIYIGSEKAEEPPVDEQVERLLQAEQAESPEGGEAS